MSSTNNPAGPDTRMLIVADYLIEYPLRYCTPVYIGIVQASYQQMSASGTAFLLQIGDDRRFLITDDHVLKGYDKDHTSNSEISFQIGAARFDPYKRLIDRNEQKDLCVFDVSDLGVEAIDDRENSKNTMPPLEFYRVEANAWPPEIVKQDESVIWGGYPGKFRSEDGLEVVSGSFSCAAAPVTGVMQDYFTCNLDRSTWTTKHGPHDPNIRLMDWGGMSGGPVFVDGQKTLRPRLVGFIMEHLRDYDQLKMSHAALIKSNGKIHNGTIF